MPADFTPTALLTLRRQSLILGALALVLFILGNHQEAAIGFDSRFVMFANEMLRNGPGFSRRPMASPTPTTAQPRPCSPGCCRCPLAK